MDEIVLDDETIDLEFTYTVTVSEHASGITHTGVTHCHDGGQPRLNFVERTDLAAHYCEGEWLGGWRVNVKARDEDHAVKIANDLIRQYQAQREPEGAALPPDPAKDDLQHELPGFLVRQTELPNAPSPGLKTVQTKVTAHSLSPLPPTFNSPVRLTTLHGGEPCESIQVHVRAVDEDDALQIGLALINLFRIRELNAPLRVRRTTDQPTGPPE